MVPSALTLLITITSELLSCAAYLSAEPATAHAHSLITVLDHSSGSLKIGRLVLVVGIHALVGPRSSARRLAKANQNVIPSHLQR